MDKFPLTMIVLVKFEKIVVEKSEKKKIELINYFYIFFQTYFTYFSLLFKDKII